MPHWKLVFQKGHFVNNLKRLIRVVLFAYKKTIGFFHELAFQFDKDKII